MSFEPVVRIALRYIAGGLFMGSVTLGERLASDPDLVAVGSLILGGLVELWYSRSKKNGRPT